MKTVKRFQIIGFILLVSLIISINSQSVDPIKASDYVGRLGKGFDVTWSEFKKYSDAYKQ